MQIVVVRAESDQVGRLAVERFLKAAGLTLFGFDEEETGVIAESDIPDTWRRPQNEFGVVAVTGRVWCDEHL